MKHLEEHILESVARKNTGKYTHVVSYRDLSVGDTLSMKTLEELPDCPGFRMKRNIPIVGQAQIAILKPMRKFLGGTIKVKSFDDKCVKDDLMGYYWPIEIFNDIVKKAK